MPQKHLILQDYVSSHLNLPKKSVENTLSLLHNDATIPFIARYRKESTGNLNEVEIETIADLKFAFEALEKRRKSIISSIEAQGKLSEKLKQHLEQAQDVSALEDLYLPYKKTRKTKADAAREQGLEPLAKIIMAQNNADIGKISARFISSEVKNKEEALQGAGHIIAEWINENKHVRRQLRGLFSKTAVLKIQPAKNAKNVPEYATYEKYFDHKERLHKIPSHRFLAIFRGEKLGILKINLKIEKEKALGSIQNNLLKNKHTSENRYIKAAAEDAFKRLLKPSFSTEFLKEAKIKADKEAINVFASNLEQLLMAAPLGSKRILALDPGFSSGCKLVCLDEKGSLLHNDTLFPHPPQHKTEAAAKKIISLVKTFAIEAIAIGNGTASRETEDFVKRLPITKNVAVYMVNEAGASVYSASAVAREEFPKQDITVRGAVSIGRRLADPLAELVKIDAKAIGVGQYQHEVDQSLLKAQLDKVVVRCVNAIGVQLNTASKELLSYVSGIGHSLAANIVAYRNSQGAFKSRDELLKVKRLGEKAFEQSAGFLRIKNAENCLDDSAVHPESYKIVESIARDQGVAISKLIGNKTLLKNIEYRHYENKEVGKHTFKDILKELEKPGVDPREKRSLFEFDPGLKSIANLQEGMKIPGIINNITNFGCFVDIGIKESGLVHISKISNKFVTDIYTEVKLNQEVMVKVLQVDKEQKRIQLSMVD